MNVKKELFKRLNSKPIKYITAQNFKEMCRRRNKVHDCFLGYIKNAPVTYTEEQNLTYETNTS